MDDRKKGQTQLPSRIATLVHAHFDALPARCKPRTRGDGCKEWIPMSGIVLVKCTCIFSLFLSYTEILSVWYQFSVPILPNIPFQLFSDEGSN
jgi:hypothetical protein